VLAAPADPDEQAGAARFGLSYQLASFAPASGWSNVPAGDPATPPQQTTLTVATTFAAQNPNRVYDVYVFDSRADARRAYDRVLLVPAAAAKDASKAAATLREGRFEEVKLRGADGLIGARTGQSAGFYVKLTDLAADLSRFKIYFTSVARANATCQTPPARPCRPAGPARTGWRSTSPTTCRPGSRPISRRSRPTSSTRTPTSSRPATWRPATATRWSATSSASSSPTPTWPWSATRSPTSSATSSSA
jgi:hypothetical protein